MCLHCVRDRNGLKVKTNETKISPIQFYVSCLAWLNTFSLLLFLTSVKDAFFTFIDRVTIFSCLDTSSFVIIFFYIQTHFYELQFKRFFFTYFNIKFYGWRKGVLILVQQQYHLFLLPLVYKGRDFVCQGGPLTLKFWLHLVWAEVALSLSFDWQMKWGVNYWIVYFSELCLFICIFYCVETGWCFFNIILWKLFML